MATALGYLTLCLVWGTTYLAIKIGLEGFDPYFMAGVRFLVAGLLMSPVLLRKSAQIPRSKSELGIIVLSGALLLVGANGLVTLSEVYLDSGLTALTVSTNPAITALIGGWFFSRDERYGKYAKIGTAISMIGVFVLHRHRLNLHHAELPGVIAACAAPVFWSLGSLIARTRISTKDVLSVTVIQMLASSILFFVISVMIGESWHADLTPRVITAMIFLILIGSSLVYAIYVWLLQHMPASRLMTYTYVNPVIAIIAGKLILDEPITGEVIPATALILGGLAVIYFMKQRDERAHAAVKLEIQNSKLRIQN